MEHRHIAILGIIVLVLLLTSGCTQSPAGTTPAPTVQSPAISISPSPVLPPAGDAKTAAAATPSVTATIPVVRGTPDPTFVVDIAVPEKMAPGTTILTDNHNPSNPRIIEVNRLGEIVWEYSLPDEIKTFTNPGWDIEVLKNNNILTVLPGYGVLEISRDKKIVWKYLDTKVSHDADRLPNGNTLVVFGAMDGRDDTQVKEIDPSGKQVWTWKAKTGFSGSDYDSVSEEGWTHTNAVTRLDSGNTLVSLRNFNLIAEIDPSGKVVKKIGEGTFVAQHDPMVLENGNILVANHKKPNEVLEISPAGSILWKIVIPERTATPVRDANKLANGNILITGADRILEVTPTKQVVWRFMFATNPFPYPEASASRGFYKAERLPA